MRKDLPTIGLAVFLSGAVIFSSFAADPAMKTLHGHVPAAVANGKAQNLGEVSSDTTINVSIGLPVRNSETLEHLVQQVSDPSSPVYGHYLTPAEFTQRFGPTAEQYQAVIDFARKNNLTITLKHPNRILLSVSGRTADIEKAFSVKMHRYQHPTEAREFFAPDREPAVPSPLSILRIEGLDNYNMSHPNLKTSPIKPPANKGSVQSAASPNLGSGPAGSYQGSDFRNAYMPGVTLTGTGQNVGLVQFNAFFASDIVAYANQIGLATIPNLVVVPIDGGVAAPSLPGNDEVSLDIEMILSMAPGVGTIYVYEAPNPSPWPDILNRMANDNLAKNLSSSWGLFAPPDPVSEQIFQQMAVQGQSFFQASGDSDAYLAGQLIPFPSDSPHITVVGGTTLSTANGGYSSETVWNADPVFGGGSSGGISPFYSIPFWQTNINFTASKGSPANRNLPDVALTGDNVLIFFGGGFEEVGAGTSCAAPLWAGLTALVNQQAASEGRQSVGFINPAIYQMAASPTIYAGTFHDVTLGNNTWSQSPNLFFAVPGYDLCTGLGTPNGSSFINSLVSFSPFLPTHVSPPPPPYGTNLSVMSGVNPNGIWALFMQDDKPINSGFVSNGWVLSLTLADIVGTAGDIQMFINPTNVSALIGQSVPLSLAVTNYGPSASTNVQVINTLPTGAVLVSSNTTQGTITRLGSTLIWNVGSLAVNAGAGLNLTFQVTGAGSLVDSATVQAGTPDPNPDDDSVVATFNSVPANVPLVPSLTGGGHSLQIGVPGPVGVGVTVVIQANTNLRSTNWVNVYTNTPPFNYVDPAASNYVQRFYRAQILP
jgi:uncharacterized repeat protein (TIGR01451 family)